MRLDDAKPMIASALMKPDHHSATAVPRQVVLVSVTALIVLGLLWELWLAPLRPGGSWLALKVLPLALALPALRRGSLRAYQWWSMGILFYLCEGAVRAMSDRGPAAAFAVIELALALLAFGGILGYVRAARRAGPPR